jgi:hypothetical protein
LQEWIKHILGNKYINMVDQNKLSVFIKTIIDQTSLLYYSSLLRIILLLKTKILLKIRPDPCIQGTHTIFFLNIVFCYLFLDKKMKKKMVWGDHSLKFPSDTTKTKPRRDRIQQEKRLGAGLTVEVKPAYAQRKAIEQQIGLMKSCTKPKLKQGMALHILWQVCSIIDKENRE